VQGGGYDPGVYIGFGVPLTSQQLYKSLVVRRYWRSFSSVPDVLTRGYQMSVQDVIGDAIFHEKHESMICVRDIEIYSMCEHHLLPFFGKAHVAYLPDGRIVGLSKIPRVVEVFARRLQVQERLTDQIADALCGVLQPLGVGVVIEAYHLCMMMRGVEKQHSAAVTSSMLGCFRNEQETRQEFLSLIRQRSNGI